MALNRQKIQDLYRKRAERYNLTANLYYLIGLREWHYRQRAVDALQRKKGDVVVELGCGTGLNFPLLQRIIGPEGRIIGVDLTDRMLEQANKRVSRHGWNNVELVLADAASFAFPAGVNGILSTFALTLMPGYDRIIRTGRDSLAPGGRFAIRTIRAKIIEARGYKAPQKEAGYTEAILSLS
jgi:demethylmenaquinone methyltransferase/2-methoxy-6-polyprenyl-1,4-benzoquinol methylase